MKALAEIERCRSSLNNILSVSVIDKDFDRERKELSATVATICDRLREVITYTDWWEDWQRAMEAKRRSSARR
jgi:hypothetical protein